MHGMLGGSAPVAGGAPVVRGQAGKHRCLSHTCVPVFGLHPEVRRKALLVFSCQWVRLSNRAETLEGRGGGCNMDFVPCCPHALLAASRAVCQVTRCRAGLESPHSQGGGLPPGVCLSACVTHRPFPFQTRPSRRSALDRKFAFCFQTIGM